MTSFPSPSTPTRTGEVCSPPLDLRVMSTALWLLATNSRASSGPTRPPCAALNRSGCCAWLHTRRRGCAVSTRLLPCGGLRSTLGSETPGPAIRPRSVARSRRAPWQVGGERSGSTALRRGHLVVACRRRVAVDDDAVAAGGLG